LKLKGQRIVPEEELGKKYGMFTVIEIPYSKPLEGFIAKTICECGVIRTRRIRTIKTAKRRPQGCGCKNAKAGSEESGYASIYATYVAQARLRKKVFELTKDQVIHLSKQSCFYCGTTNGNKFKLNRRAKEVVPYMGIDRIDSSLGYVTSNCIPCCRDCNNAKNDKSVEAFVRYAYRLYNHLFRE
jgi:5-methylcytosine-specific restriction endonuclease McrA